MVVIRTATYPFAEVPAGELPVASFAERLAQESLNRLAGALSIPTISKSVSLPENILSTVLRAVVGTDAYKYQTVNDNIYRFMPAMLTTAEQGTIHNGNEHI